MSKNCKDLSVYEDNAVSKAIIKAVKGLEAASDKAQIAIRSVSNIAYAIVETEENKKQSAQLIRDNCSVFTSKTLEESQKHSQIRKNQEQLGNTIEKTLFVPNNKEEEPADYMELIMALDSSAEEIKSR